LSDERLRELLEVQVYFGLPSPALVEKDFYVVKSLAAIAAINPSPLRLVFGGGTALSRAHRLVRRMSEDIDLRIVGDKTPGRGALRRLRDAITEALLSAGFKFDPKDPAYRKSGNESRYTIYRLPYEPAATGEGALRSTIQIETAVWPLRRPAAELPVISFVAEALRRPPEIASMACVSILETAADKFVGLTRRAGAELAGLEEPDPTLVDNNLPSKEGELLLRSRRGREVAVNIDFSPPGQKSRATSGNVAFCIPRVDENGCF
jgi:hypothetical protein